MNPSIKTREREPKGWSGLGSGRETMVCTLEGTNKNSDDEKTTSATISRRVNLCVRAIE